MRPNRQHRRRHGKSDEADAIGAARAVLAGDEKMIIRCLKRHLIREIYRAITTDLAPEHLVGEKRLFVPFRG